MMIPTGASDLQPLNIPHTCVASVVIISTMAAMDVYLVEQNAGARRLGVGALALAGDLFFLLVLRYAATWVGGEARLAQRGHAMVLWFLFAFALEIKLYFIYQHYATEGRVPDPLARRTLTLLLSVCIPALYMVLGATELVAQAASSFRKNDELRGRLFWVILDLLDVLEIQACLWEPQRRVLPLWAEGLAFFYSYGLLLVLPCVSLSELGMRGPHPGSLYPLLSLASVNVATIFIRGGLLLLCHDQRVSSIFMGKNILAIALKCCAVLHHRSTGGGSGHGNAEADPADPQSQEVHRNTGVVEEASHIQAALLDQPLRSSQTTSGQSCRHIPGTPSQEPAQITATIHHRPSPGGNQLLHSKDQFHQNPQAQTLHSPHHYGPTTHPSPTPMPGPHPSAPRSLRAGHHVQLKSVWGVHEVSL